MRRQARSGELFSESCRLASLANRLFGCFRSAWKTNTTHCNKKCHLPTYRQRGAGSSLARGPRHGNAMRCRTLTVRPKLNDAPLGSHHQRAAMRLSANCMEKLYFPEFLPYRQRRWLSVPPIQTKARSPWPSATRVPPTEPRCLAPPERSTGEFSFGISLEKSADQIHPMKHTTPQGGFLVRGETNDE